MRTDTTDINDYGNDMVITFDTDAVPVPPPIARLLRQHLGDRPNMQTAANRTSPWLLPGLQAGQPLTADRMNHQLRHLGIPLRQARNSALRQLVQDMPPAVAARTLGYSQNIVLEARPMYLRHPVRSPSHLRHDEANVLSQWT